MSAWPGLSDAPLFNDLTYYPGGRFTTPFGIAAKIDRGEDDGALVVRGVRLHNACDRARGNLCYWPFTGSGELLLRHYADSFGTLLRIFPEGADFEVRIGHFDPEELTGIARSYVESESEERWNFAAVPAGTPIAPAGNMGLSTAPHLHTEVVSRREASPDLERLTERAPGAEWNILDEVELRQEAERRGLSYDIVHADVLEQVERKGVVWMTNRRCQRRDYHTGLVRTFYSSRVVFNGM